MAQVKWCKDCKKDIEDTIRINQNTYPSYVPISTCKKHVWYKKTNKETK